MLFSVLGTTLTINHSQDEPKKTAAKPWDSQHLTNFPLHEKMKQPVLNVRVSSQLEHTHQKKTHIIRFLVLNLQACVKTNPIYTIVTIVNRSINNGLYVIILQL